MSDDGGTASGAFLEVIGWALFQHYSDRNPPWVKLHRMWLSRYSFTRLSDAARSHLMLIWVIASQNDNLIPDDLVWIQGAILARSSVNLDALIAPDPLDEEKWSGFLRRVDADRNLLSSRKHGASTALAPDEPLEEKRREEKSIVTDRIVSFCEAFKVKWDLKRTEQEWLQEMVERYPDVDVPEAIDECRDWWESQIATGGKKSLKAPSRAIGNWLKNARKWKDDEESSSDDPEVMESV